MIGAREPERRLGSAAGGRAGARGGAARLGGGAATERGWERELPSVVGAGARCASCLVTPCAPRAATLGYLSMSSALEMVLIIDEAPSTVD